MSNIQQYKGKKVCLYNYLFCYRNSSFVFPIDTHSFEYCIRILHNNRYVRSMSFFNPLSIYFPCGSLSPSSAVTHSVKSEVPLRKPVPKHCRRKAANCAQVFVRIQRSSEPEEPSLCRSNVQLETMTSNLLPQRL